jgi:hypothetical protein
LFGCGQWLRCDTVPIATSTAPSGITVISAFSRGAPVAVST